MTEYLIVFGVVVAALAAIYRLLGLGTRSHPVWLPKGPLVFAGPRGRVKIDMLAIVDIGRPTRRAAGVLIGRHIVDTEDVVVDEATAEALGENDFRSAQPHQNQIDYAQSRTGGRIGYVGEWQTAERGQSFAYFAFEWQRRLREDVVNFPHTLFVLVYPDRMRVWEGETATGRLVEMKQATADWWPKTPVVADGASA